MLPEDGRAGLHRPGRRLPPADRARAQRHGRGAAAWPVRGLHPHRTRRHGHRPRGAHGHGPGHLQRHCHAGRRGARRRLVTDAGRGRVRQPQALWQPRLGRADAGYRWLHRHGQLVPALSPGRGDGTRDAGPGRGQILGRARGRHPRRERRRVPPRRQAGGLRRAGGRGRRHAGTGRGHAQGPEGLALHWQREAAPAGLGREDHRQAAVHDRRQAARHADRGRGAPAAVRRNRQVVRCQQGQGGQGRGRRRADPARRCRRGPEQLGGDQGPRGADRGVGRECGREARHGPAH